MHKITIKNILFDLGGVLLDLDKERCLEAFKKIGVDLNSLGFYGQSGLFGELELGTISEETFYMRFRKEFGTKASNSKIKEAWNSFLVGIPEKRLEYLEHLSNNYNLFLLSNTSKIHFDHWQNMFDPQLGAGRYFDGIFCSFEFHIAKPDKRAFQHVIEATGIVPDETLFFDDSAKNIQTAAEMGFNVQLIDEDEELLDFNIVRIA